MTSKEGRISASIGKPVDARIERKRWTGDVPEECDLCQGSIEDTFIDGATRMGPWANMCPRCHRAYGVGLGTGRGQKYALGDPGNWYKVEG